MRVKKTLVGLLLVIILLVSLFILTSCGKKAECSKSTDCRNTKNQCDLSRCSSDGKCIPDFRKDCCGNAKCDDAAGENKCTCSADCGKCTGKVTYTVTTSRGPKQVNASYAVYLCDNNACVVGVSPEQVAEKKLTNEIDERGGFKAEVLTTMNYPFTTRKDVANVRILLKDLDPDVIGGIIFKRVQVLDGGEVMGEQLMNQELLNVDDLFNQNIPLTSSQSIIEESKTVDIKIDYEYVVTDTKGVAVTKRASSKNRLSEKILFISE